MLTKKPDCRADASLEISARRPPRGRAKLREIAVIIPHLDRFVLLRKGDAGRVDIGVFLQDANELEQALVLGMPEIEDVAVELFIGTRQKQGFDHVVDIVEIAPLPSRAEHIDPPPVQRLSQKDADETRSRAPQVQPGAV